MDYPRAIFSSTEPFSNNQNDVNLGPVTDDDEHEKVFLVKVIQFKGVARKAEPGYKPAYQVQTRLKQQPPKELI